jgi:hypothetical protein
MKIWTVEHYGVIAEELLRHHFLAQLSGTYLANVEAQLSCMLQGVQPYEAVNVLAREYALPHIEAGMFSILLAQDERRLTLDDQVQACERLWLFELIEAEAEHAPSMAG